MDRDWTNQKVSSGEWDLILDALEYYERKDYAKMEELEMVLKVLPPPPEEELREAFEKVIADLTRQGSKLKEERRRRRERVTLLKAKIIMSQQSDAADKIMDDARKPMNN